MEENGRTRLYFKNNIRLPNSVRTKASTSYAQSTEFSPVDASFSRNGSNYSQNDITRGAYSHATDSKFHFTNVSGTQRRRGLQTDFQSQSPKPIRRCLQLPADKYFQNPRLPSTERLDGENRPISGIFPSANYRGSQKIFTASLPRPIASNELPSLRAQFSTENVCLLEQLDCPDTSRPRNACSNLFRRLPVSQSRSRNTGESRQNHSGHPKIFRMDDKLRKVYPATKSSNRISRHIMGSVEEHKITSSKKVPENENRDHSLDQQAKSMPKGITKHHRNDELFKLCCTSRKDKFSSTSKTMHQHVTPETSNTDLTAGGSPEGLAMVAKLSRDFVSYPCPTSNTLYCHRCLRQRLGCLHKQHLCIRHLERTRKIASLQSKGDACDPKNDTILWPKPAQYQFTRSVRQQDSGIVSEERRRYKISSAYRPDLPDSAACRFLPDSLNHLPHSGCIQRRSGQTISTAEATRVESTPSSNAPNICPMGNPSDRLVRVSASPCSPQVLQSGSPRSAGRVSRCLQPNLELSIGMDFSATILDTESADPSEQMSRNISDCRPEMGASLLETGSEKSGNRPPLDDQEPLPGTYGHLNQQTPSQGQRNDIGSLEMWGWNEKLSDWTTQQKHLLMKSWRSSTVRTYKPAWARWIKWAKLNHISVSEPSGSALARFLADLHQNEGLSYNTILVHKAVVSTLCCPEFSERLSGHPLVKRILKSIALAIPKPSKTPVWDVKQVVSLLCQQNPDIDKLYEVSQHTACLLLLCSGRRVHDLTLLSINCNHCEITTDYVIFWPIFGSKTDSANYRQSGWKLMINKNNKCLDPVHWILKLISLGGNRRNEAKCDNLFVTTYGKARPASRCVIATWVKKVLKDAGIEAPAGSFRSAVASKSWYENCSVDEILSRGNWRSENTFRRFYRKEVKKADGQNSVTNLFNAV